ncbi:MAG TPA: nuclear transport factor 2 family protein [Gammaproteobacteria bacterium]|nr:nuclear transport factor 2 family protein [Gammaproteobacteria bacterium]
MRLHLMAFACLASATDALAEVVDDVRCSEIGFSLAAEQRNAERFVTFIDPDARFVGTSVRRGTEAILGDWAAFFEPGGPSIKWRPQFVEVLEDGRLALTRGPYRVAELAENGTIVERWGTFNSVWRLGDDGKWRVVFDAGTPAMEPPPERVRALLDAPVACN